MRDRLNIILILMLIGVAACGRSTPAPVVHGSKVPSNSINNDQSAGRVSSRETVIVAPLKKPAKKTIRINPVNRKSGPGAGEHQVTTGETLYGLSRRYAVPLRALIDRNRLKPPYALNEGQILKLPRPLYHRVAAGETLYGLSRRYDTDVHLLVRANNLAAPYELTVGQRLRITDRDDQPVRSDNHQKSNSGKNATEETAERVKHDNRFRKLAGVVLPPIKPERDRAQGARRVYGKSSGAKPPPRAGRRFYWPVSGPILSRFGRKPGGRRNDGINISAKNGTPVRAAENGVVAYAGNELKGFGNLLILRHAGGWLTAYAHTARIVVKPGQRVRRGQIIARVGRSGNVTKPQLHFEVRNGRRVYDPLRYLINRRRRAA